MTSHLLPAFRMITVMTVLTGLFYPSAVTGLAQVVFPSKAHGSLLTVNGQVVGSSLIGQNFARPDYFHPRPSAAGANGYDAAYSGGSNLGPTNKNPGYTGQIPADAVTASGSGLDPHISPANAEIQAARVASARGIDATSVRTLVTAATERPWLGFIGEARVNVLEVNLALDQRFPKK